MKDQIFKDLKSLINRMADYSNELDSIKDDIEREINIVPPEPDISEFSDEQIFEEFEYRDLGRRSDIAIEDWKMDLFKECAHKFSLEEIEIFLNSK